MKIALISQPFDAIVPPSLNSIGIWVNEISRRLAKNHSVVVYARKGITRRTQVIGDNVHTKYVFSLPNLWLTSLSENISHYRHPKQPLYAAPAFYLEYILPIALDLRRRKIDIVHIQNYSQFIPVIRAFNPEIKIVLHMRCEWLALLDYHMIDRRLHKTDLILGVSNEIINAVRQRFPQHAHKCQTAYTGVDTNDFQPLDPPLERKGDGRRLLFVGRITPEKGTHVLLEAFKQVAPRFPDLRLDLVGSIASLSRDRLVTISDEKKISDLGQFYSGGDYLSRLKEILPPELENQIHFVGHVRYAQTIEYYQNADILINPALSEPFGRSLIEGNACGVPVIACRAGGMSELVEPGVNGFLVEPGDADELARAIQTLLENEPLRKQMGEAGRRFAVEKFSWECITRDLESLYTDLLREKEAA